ncbi:MAG: uroporphyrinogen-III C-methyltransferase [Candidatus Eremiobacteraeota bacterium]|nr:uroporphyrinogen-III C-methyltransferase [Candidatus Eremiobacteraeota bacterium]
MPQTKRGKVFLVGAGPGDPGLLTLRAAAVLSECEVLLYDALASDATVALAAPSSEKVFVGKRGGTHAMPQSQIEELLVAHARAGKFVVRLKGGDPFVFGRGGEEAQSLAQAGIPFEVVPGMTSAIAAPAYAGIPVTHRDCNTAFTIATGHEDPEKPESTIDWDGLADPHQTLVLLMAMGNLAEIARKLQERGLPPDRPVAVIRNGTRPSQETLVSTLAGVAADVERAGLGAPAIVVVGDVVRFRDELRWFDRSALFGKRVLVTRPGDRSADIASALLSRGAQPVLAPTVRIERPEELRQASARAAREAGSYEWLAFTSSYGVEIFFASLAEAGLDARRIGTARVAAIGPKTAETLQRFGVKADAIPPRYVEEDLAATLVDATASGSRILLFGARESRGALARILAEAGRDVVTIAAYATVMCDVDGFADIVCGCDVLTFTSESTVRGFAHNLGGDDAAVTASRGKLVACIGPITAQSARAIGLEVSVESTQSTVDGMLDAIETCR